MDETTFDIRHHDGKVERIVTRGERIVIGSGGHADIRLPVDQAAFEHVVITSHAGGVRIESRAQNPRATLDGAPFQFAELAPSATLALGATQMIVTRRVQDAAPKQKVGGTAVVRLGIALLLPVVIYMFTMRAAPSSAASPQEMPALFSAAAVSCPRTEADLARSVADDQRLIADAARERSPFEPREGVAAVTAYKIAAACYRVSSDERAARDAADMDATANELSDTITRDFRARRIRLERTLALKDYEVASQDTAVLLALTEGKSGSYVTWLQNQQQFLRNQKPR